MAMQDKENRRNMRGYGETFSIGTNSIIYGDQPEDDIVKQACHAYLEIAGARTYLAVRVSSGTECNVMPLVDFAYLFPSKVTSKGLPKHGVLEPNAAVLECRMSGNDMDHYGTINLIVNYKGMQICQEFFVTKEGQYGILGFPAMREMGMWG